jgi:hypothetical protein
MIFQQFNLVNRLDVLTNVLVGRLGYHQTLPTLFKLFSEINENAELGAAEGFLASSGDWFQMIRYAVVPRVFPVILPNMLYYFESNTRSATILGNVGAGGIGLQLADRILGSGIPNHHNDPDHCVPDGRRVQPYSPALHQDSGTPSISF